MTLDPHARAFLAAQAEHPARGPAGADPGETPVAELRAANRDSAAARFGPVAEVGAVRDLTVPGAGGRVAVRAYLPDAPPPHPVLVYHHGGGWMMGDLETHDGVCRALCAEGGCAVVAVDYRLSPEHRFPAALEDSWSAIGWVTGEAGSARLGLDSGRLAIGGESSGGNLAAVAALRARDAGLPVALQVLVYPVLDARLDTSSYSEFERGFNLDAADMARYWREYLGPHGDPADPRASPERAPDLRGVAPAFVITCECDVLRDEGEAYARRLSAAGVPVSLRREAGMIHGFYRMPALIPRAREALHATAAALAVAFAAGGPPRL